MNFSENLKNYCLAVQKAKTIKKELRAQIKYLFACNKQASNAQIEQLEELIILWLVLNKPCNLSEIARLNMFNNHKAAALCQQMAKKGLLILFKKTKETEIKISEHGKEIFQLIENELSVEGLY